MHLCYALNSGNRSEQLITNVVAIGFTRLHLKDTGDQHQIVAYAVIEFIEQARLASFRSLSLGDVEEELRHRVVVDAGHADFVPEVDSASVHLEARWYAGL